VAVYRLAVIGMAREMKVSNSAISVLYAPLKDDARVRTIAGVARRPDRRAAAPVAGSIASAKSHAASSQNTVSVMKNSPASSRKALHSMIRPEGLDPLLT